MFFMQLKVALLLYLLFRLTLISSTFYSVLIFISISVAFLKRHFLIGWVITFRSTPTKLQPLPLNFTIKII